MLFPISSGFSQKSDTQSALSVALTSGSPFVYKDSEGYTVVVGEVTIALRPSLKFRLELAFTVKQGQFHWKQLEVKLY